MDDLAAKSGREDTLLDGEERLGKENWTLLHHLHRVRLGCAHQTPSVDAETMLLEVMALFERIIAGKVPVVQRQEKRGEMFCLWREEEGRDGGEVRFAIGAPERLCEEVRRQRERDGKGTGREGGGGGCGDVARERGSVWIGCAATFRPSQARLISTSPRFSHSNTTRPPPTRAGNVAREPFYVSNVPMISIFTVPPLPPSP